MRRTPAHGYEGGPAGAVLSVRLVKKKKKLKRKNMIMDKTRTVDLGEYKNISVEKGKGSLSNDKKQRGRGKSGEARKQQYLDLTEGQVQLKTNVM